MIAPLIKKSIWGKNLHGLAFFAKWNRSQRELIGIVVKNHTAIRMKGERSSGYQRWYLLISFRTDDNELKTAQNRSLDEEVVKTDLDF